jgi:four helix bundle protein
MLEYTVELKKEKLIIHENTQKYKIDLRKRLFVFSKNVLMLLMKLPDNKEFDVFRYQLSKSATAIGANYEESQATTFAEFRQRIHICLREAKETEYWLKLIQEIIGAKDITIKKKTAELLDEINEILKIFGSIASKIRRKLQTKPESNL